MAGQVNTISNFYYVKVLSTRLSNVVAFWRNSTLY